MDRRRDGRQLKGTPERELIYIWAVAAMDEVILYVCGVCKLMRGDIRCQSFTPAMLYMSPTIPGSGSEP